MKYTLKISLAGVIGLVIGAIIGIVVIWLLSRLAYNFLGIPEAILEDYLFGSFAFATMCSQIAMYEMDKAS